MKDLSDRFADTDGAGEPRPPTRPDALARLESETPDAAAVPGPLRRVLVWLSGRADFLAVMAAAAAAVVLLWPQFHPQTVMVPPAAATGDEMATVVVRPFSEGGVTAAPDWYGLFNANQLETSLRDISIRCNFGLPVDARVDRYIHVRLEAGTAIRVFLADPGTCPKL